MGHKHPAINLHADGFSKLNALALSIRTITIDGNAVDETVGEGGAG
ncbi:hypothetical protein [Shimia isoporae]